VRSRASRPLVEAIADLDPFDYAAEAFIQSAWEPVGTAGAAEHERLLPHHCGARLRASLLGG
jgi:hypothetical protein